MSRQILMGSDFKLNKAEYVASKIDVITKYTCSKSGWTPKFTFNEGVEPQLYIEEIDNKDGIWTTTIKMDVAKENELPIGIIYRNFDEDENGTALKNDFLLSVDELQYTHKIVSCTNMFLSCIAIKHINTMNFDTSNVTSMTNMFHDCRVPSLDVSNFNTSKVTNMNEMFRMMDIKTLDIRNFDMSNVNNVTRMFYCSRQLEEIKFPKNFFTDKITQCFHIFQGCSSLVHLDVTNWKIGKSLQTTHFEGFFQNCKKLKEIKGIENLDVSRATTLRDMFNGCNSLTSLNLSNWDTSNVTNMIGMFRNCNALTELDLSNFNTSKVTSMDAIVRECSSLKSLDISNFDIRHAPGMTYFGYGTNLETLNIGPNFKITSEHQNLSNFFHGFCNKFTGISIDVSDWDFSNVQNAGSAFRGCCIKLIGYENWDVSKVIDMSYFFNFGADIRGENIDISSWDLSKCNLCGLFYGCGAKTIKLGKVCEDVGKETYSMFSDCTNLEKIEFTQPLKITGAINNMFYNCNKLTELDISNWNTSNVTNMQSMFKGCTNLTSLNVNNLDTSKTTSMLSMFRDCQSLTSLDLSSFNTSNATSMAEMFHNCYNLTSITFGSDFNTNNVFNMGYMFFNCAKLIELDLNNFNTTNVNYMDNMFNGCQSLTSLNINNWNTSNVTDMTSMFAFCTSLETIEMPNWNVEKVTKCGYMFNFWGKAFKLKYVNFDNWELKSITPNGPMFSCIDSNDLNFKSPKFYNSFDLTNRLKFTEESLLDILNKLPQVDSTEGKYIILKDNLNRLTDEQKAIATNKGWTLY